jgi:hypothetical protein
MAKSEARLGIFGAQEDDFVISECERGLKMWQTEGEKYSVPMFWECI